MKLSIIIITKNEENMIEHCIKSVKFADEVIVIDSKSTDNTMSIAKKLGATVVTHKFDNYADQRNFGLKHAKGDWLLYIDADEWVNESLKIEVNKITNGEISIAHYSAYRIPRKNYYLGHHEWPHIEYIERLFLKKNLKKWQGAVHEHAVYDGEVGTLKNYLIHYTHRDLSSMIRKTNVWGDIEAQMLFDADHPQMNQLRFIRIMLTKFYNSFIKQNGWKAGTAGLIESMYQSYSYFIIYAKLWEKQKANKKLNVKI